MARTYTCRRCGGQGHNRAVCPRSPETDGTYDRARPLLGKETDEDVAAHVGTSTQTVTSWRRRLGIPKAPRRSDPEVKYPGITLRLGVDSDVAIAADYGLSRERVRQIRHSLNINKAPVRAFDAAEMYDMLGRVPDTHIAEAMNLPVGFVRKERLRAGFPPVSLTDYYDEIVGRAHDRVGTVSDRQLACELGVSIGQVSAYRRRRGIQPFVKSPRCSDFVPLDRGKVARMFHEGATDDEIAAELDTTPATVCQIRYQIGLIRHTRRNQLPQYVVDEVRRRIAAGEVRWRIAEDLGLNASTVYRISTQDDP